MTITRNSRSPVSSLVLVLLVAFSAICGANALRQRSFSENVESSDVVVVAAALESDRNGQNEIVATTFRVESVLKGDVAESNLSVLHGNIAEFKLDCCVIGKYYLLLLKLNLGSYVSVNGRYGVIELPTR